nr:unnamed protein product [Digitaria exilis]
MLPRRQSIFHLGEEGGAAAAVHHRVGVVGAAMAGGANARRARERERLAVGLQILVHHHAHSHGRHAHAANVVLKQMVRPRAAAAASRHGGHHGHAVGDQGFCSEECRWEQIMVDEGRERQEAMVSKERQRRGQAHHHSPHHTPKRGRPPPRKSLAVA